MMTESQIQHCENHLQFIRHLLLALHSTSAIHSMAMRMFIEQGHAERALDCSNLLVNCNRLIENVEFEINLHETILRENNPNCN